MFIKSIPVNIDYNSIAYKAKLLLYLQEKNPLVSFTAKRATIIICPGGGYHRIEERECDPTAIRFLNLGFNTAILRYSVLQACFPIALMQLMKAFRIIKELSNETTINSDKIIIMGFSAGGHLASLLGENWDNRLFVSSDKIAKKYYKPSSLVLCYPVITTGKYKYQPCFSNLPTLDKFKSLLSIEENVSDNFPPTFIWHTEHDSLVDVHNSLLLVNRLIDEGIPCEFHMYERGCHGMGIVSKDTTPDNKANNFSYDAANWPSIAARWLHSR